MTERAFPLPGLKTGSFERGYDAGNYANAYETENLESALQAEGYDDDMPLSVRRFRFREGFVLGFFSSYELDEIPDEHREEVEYLRGIYED